MNKPGPRCSVCSNPNVAAIDAERDSVADVAQRYALSPSTLQRHRQHVRARLAVTAPSTRGTPAKAARVQAGAQRSRGARKATQEVEQLGPLDPRREAEDAVRRARRHLDQLEGDAKVSPRERAAATAALTSTIRVLARIAGDLPVTEEQIVKSPTWRAILGRLEVALKQYPEACRAMAKALTEGA
jgi:hypothetical protein